MMESIDKDIAKNLFKHYRQNRDGIRNCPEMASICLICQSVHIDPVEGESGRFICRNCRFQFTRYRCAACGATVDSRDPQNPPCEECGTRICTCGFCGCVK
ncbi:MAG: hypothetical protein R2864_09250 [Syntrophotaleaceae bacterium]